MYLLVCFDSGSLLVLPFLAGLDPFKVVSNRMGKIESYWVRLNKVNKESAQGSGW